MCFSAEASFIGAAALAVIGSATLKITPRRHKLWAAIPLLFAFQQFCEGLVWLDMRGTLPHSALTVLAKDLFLFFALVLWPVWFPLSFFVAETDGKRKAALFVLLLFGVGVSSYNLMSYSILELSPALNKHSIRYFVESDFYRKLAYIVMIALPPLISSLKHMKIFGLLAIVSCIVAEYFYFATFTSVWCFLGGLMSAALYLIARANFSEEEKAEEKVIHK